MTHKEGLLMSPISTEEAARLVGIGRNTLERWIREGKVTPKTVRVGRKNYRLWTEREIEKLRYVKEKNYRKGRGRKKKLKK